MNTTPADQKKIVYILGAGFSIPAGAPPQRQILADIFALDTHIERVRAARSRLQEFLAEDLRILPEAVADVALEDVYTPIDRCIADGTSLKSRSAGQLTELRENLGYLISVAISQRIAKQQETPPFSTKYIHDFARHLAIKASKRAALAKDNPDSSRAKQYDPFSIISLNWDILLDNALHSALESIDPGPVEDYSPFGVVDYCCYVSSLYPGDTRIRSGLWSLGCRGYNVKLLKLHGSMNWLQCPNCQRLFVGFGDKQQILEHVGTDTCRHCMACGYDNKLAGSLVMPTFLKDLSNFQIKLVWQNAGVELMEARRLVFIGYSLPNADFEFRQLLSRMVHKDAAIDVVLYEGSSEDAKRRFRAEKDRYSQFFGDRQLQFHPSGAVRFVESHVNGEPQPSLPHA